MALSRRCSPRTSVVSTPIEPPPGCAAHGRVERQSGVRSRRGHLQPAHLVVLTEARVAAHLESELLGVEGEGRVLVGDGEHGHADVRHGGGG